MPLAMPIVCIYKGFLLSNGIQGGHTDYGKYLTSFLHIPCH